MIHFFWSFYKLEYHDNILACDHPVTLPLCSDSCYLLSILPTSLPLELAVEKIHEDIFWKRKYIDRWPKIPPIGKSFSAVSSYRKNTTLFNNNSNSASVTRTSSLSSSKSTLSDISLVYSEEKSWKQCYLEKHLEEELETLEPQDYDPEKVFSSIIIDSL